MAVWSRREGPNRESESSLNRQRELEVSSWESILHKHNDTSDKSEKLFNRLGNTCDSKLTPRETAPRYHDDSMDKSVQTITRLQSVKGSQTYPQEKKGLDQRTFACSNQSDYSDYSLDHLRNTDEYKMLVCVGKRRYQQWTREVQDKKRDNSEKSFIRCNTSSSNQLIGSGGKDQMECEDLRTETNSAQETMGGTLNEGSESPMSQHVVRANNEVVEAPSSLTKEQKRKFSSVDLQQSWGKAVSFITNTSSKLSLSTAFRGLMQTPEVTERGQNQTFHCTNQNDLDNVNHISDSSFTFFL